MSLTTVKSKPTAASPERARDHLGHGEARKGPEGRLRKPVEGRPPKLGPLPQAAHAGIVPDLGFHLFDGHLPFENSAFIIIAILMLCVCVCFFILKRA